MKKAKYNLALMIIVVLCTIAPAFAQPNVTFQYAYDSAGRVTQVVDSLGNALLYTYDSAGNILSIAKQTGVMTAIFGATDANGISISAATIGQTVTLSGVGLGDCPNVTVTVDGITATITAKTTNTLSIVIPAGATAGVIVVNTCHGSATFTLLIGSVVVDPPIVILLPGQTYTFTATVTPSSLSQGVSWSVDGILGGSKVTGTITTGGFYTAPSGGGTVTIQATSDADPELSGTATVSATSAANTADAFSPGVSVFVLGAGQTALQSGYVLAPGVSVLQFGAGQTALQSGYVLSPGVSVLQFGAGQTALESGYILSPGVSVQAATLTGSAIIRVPPLRTARGGTRPNRMAVTISGVDLDRTRLVAALDDDGKPDAGIHVLNAVVRDNGHTLALNLSVSEKAKPGKHKLVVWTAVRTAPATEPGPNHAVLPSKGTIPTLPQGSENSLAK